MEQHGGSIPFTILGGVHHERSKGSNKKSSSKKKGSSKTLRRKKVSKTRRRLKPLSSKGYSVGTIIRHKGHLMKLNSSRKWTKV
jgi:hypothetical protein